MNKERNYNVDLMRFLGVLIIMIAHSSPPEWLFQLRNFGTPLLIVVSALTYSLIYAQRNIDIINFYKKRLSRLSFPAWIFLSTFFAIVFFATYSLNVDYPFTIQQIIFTYSFLGGVLGIWIFKVYIILALITPLAIAYNRSIKSNYIYFSTLVLLYFIYEVLVHLISPHLTGNLIKIFNNVIFLIAPYSLLYLYGFRLSKLSKSQITIIATISCIIFIVLAFAKYMSEGHLVPTQYFKYPPTIYYLSYAFFALNMVYLVCRSLPLFQSYYSNIVLWLSSNSLWIYLWHIMAFYIWKYTIGPVKGYFILFIVKSLFLLSFGIICTVIQKRLAEKFIPRNNVFGKRLSSLLT